MTTDSPHTPPESPAAEQESETITPQAPATEPAQPADSDQATETPATGAVEAEQSPAKMPPRRQIQVGSRRPGSEQARPKSRPSQAGTGTAAIDQARELEEGDLDAEQMNQMVAQARVRVPKPSRRDPLSADLEAEFEAMLADVSIGDLVSGEVLQPTGEPLEAESRVAGTIEKISGDDVFFRLDGRNQGVASLRQFDETPEIGTRLEVVIRSFQADDGLYEVAVPGASVDVSGWEDLVEGAVVEARITGSNSGGLECLVNTLRGFIPASQVEVFRVDNFEEYVDQKLQCVVTEANERKRNLVLSHRAVVERERAEARKQLLEELEPGQVREGVVTSVRDFGAFVDLGGIDGLVHISQLSWERVQHPSEVLETGQKVRVKVDKVDEQTGKISLSYRDLLERPWDTAEERFLPNTTVKGVVTRTTKFGAFVKVAPGVEGLVHISELAHHRVVQVTNVVKEGDDVDVVVLTVDADEQRMSLSMKAAHPLPAAEESSEKDQPEVDEPPPEPIVPKHEGPLKGGTGRSSGGDQFGLKW